MRINKVIMIEIRNFFNRVLRRVLRSKIPFIIIASIPLALFLFVFMLAFSTFMDFRDPFNHDSDGEYSLVKKVTMADVVGQWQIENPYFFANSEEYFELIENWQNARLTLEDTGKFSLDTPPQFFVKFIRKKTGDKFIGNWTITQKDKNLPVIDLIDSNNNLITSLRIYKLKDQKMKSNNHYLHWRTKEQAKFENEGVIWKKISD